LVVIGKVPIIQGIGDELNSAVGDASTMSMRKTNSGVENKILKNQAA
jgi:hypothetical protein